MTPLELRILQLVSREGGKCTNVTISQRTSRHTAADRKTALHTLEALDLVSSAVVASVRGGRAGGGGLVYWLTEQGKAWVEDARARGEIKDRVPT